LAVPGVVVGALPAVADEVGGLDRIEGEADGEGREDEGKEEPFLEEDRE
jgi:hypothetical protein